MVYSSAGRLIKRVSGLIILSLIFFSTSSQDLVVQSIASNHFVNSVNLNDSEDSAGRFEGYNLFVLERKNLNKFEVMNRTLLITDLEGDIYFNRELGAADSIDRMTVDFINSTTVLIGDEQNAYLWNIESNTTKVLGFGSHHDLEYNYADDTYFTLKAYDIEYNDSNNKFDYVNEYTEEGTLVWQLDTRSFIDFSQWCPYNDYLPPYNQYGGTKDISHANSVVYDEEEDVLYLSCRNVNTFYKINHENKEVLWGLGEYGDFTMYSINGIEIDHLFFHPHSVEKIDDNRFLLFDNDFHNQTVQENHQSRLLEITIDEDKMYANITREWTAPSDYFSFGYGDCDILPNNNLLGVFGTHTHPDNNDVGAILVEVDPNGDIQWEISYPENGPEAFAVYSMERFRFTPIVSMPKLVDEGDDTGYVEWDVWYNFRSKTQFAGNYYVTIDNQTVDTGEIVFPRYWKSTQHRYYLDALPEGELNISLVVSDEGGHLSNDSEIFNSQGPVSLNKNFGRNMTIGFTLGGSTILSIIVIWMRFVKKKTFFKKKK